MSNIDTNINIQTSQQFHLSQSMQKALLIMQLPILELKEWLENELELNPILERQNEVSEKFGEFNTNSSPKFLSFNESEDTHTDPFYAIHDDFKSLYTHLEEQVFINLDKKHFELAKLLIGNICEKGFLDVIPQEAKDNYPEYQINEVLEKIQTFNPLGIGAKDAKHCLLIQLAASGKKDSLGYKIIDSFYQELLDRKFILMSKQLHLSIEQIHSIIKKEISILDPFPGLRFSQNKNSAIIPDASIEKIEDQLFIRINKEILPKFSINKSYQKSFSNFSKSEKQYISRNYNSAKWLIESVNKRNLTLLRILKYILKKQSSFFHLESKELKPMTITQVAKKLELHESTVARAVNQKYIECPQGIFLLRYFFSSNASKNNNEKSSQSAKQLLQKLIKSENKKAPLSDLDLVLRLKEQGYSCARRTITKYRQSLNIETASKRKIG